MQYNITALFVCLDEFCKSYEEWEKHRLIDTGKKRHRSCEMSLSEMLTIIRSLTEAGLMLNLFGHSICPAARIRSRID